MKKYTGLEKVGIKFQMTFDNTFAMFNALRLLSKKLRYIFYIFMITTVGVALYFCSFLINLHYYDLSNDMINLINIIGFSILAISVFLVSTIIGYEPLIVNGKKNEDIKEYLLDKKIEKEKKKQFWRLRNMNLFFRISTYFFIWFWLLQVAYFFVVAAVIKTSITPNVPHPKEDYLLIINELMTTGTIIVSCFLVLFILRIEYKNFKTNKKEI